MMHYKLSIVSYLKGGAQSGFRHVEPEQYEARLLQFKKEGSKVQMTELRVYKILEIHLL